ncbi:MAG: hypothetical protein KDD98_02290 [Sphingomonadaceae bacterium]|nr:hypothetical protein [Sphingomonadaceae bacterium]
MSGCGGESAGPSPSPTPAPSPTPTPTPTPTPPPAGFLERDIDVAFVGGSITAGATLSARSNWSYQTWQYLDGKFQSAAVHDYAVPGTTTHFATHRLKAEMAGVTPDIGFIEFAANDASFSRAQIWSYTDAVINIYREANPDMLIVYVAVGLARDEADRRAGREPANVTYAREISEENGILFIDAGAALWDEIIAGRATLAELLPDGVHPSRAGYDVYAAAVQSALDGYLATEPSVHVISSRYIGQTGLGQASMETGRYATGCRVEAQVGIDKYLSDALVCEEGQSFELSFTGTTMGVVQARNTDAGRLACTIDGQSYTPIGFYLPSAGDPPKIFVQQLYTGLPNQNHTVRCTALAFANDPSRNRIIIGRFLFNAGTLLNR